MTEVKQRLTSARALTLVGPGGIGKSRVARRVVEDERGVYRDGCWVVDLSSVPGPALVATTVAVVLGLRADVENGHPAGTAGLLADFVADREALLVLDGCDRVLEAAADLVHRLRVQCPRLRILVTSRQRLGISGEVLIRVPPLTVPATGTPVPAEALLQFESVSLFVDRARLARPDFRLSSLSASAVAEVCVALEGNPLAIELVAARIDSLTPHTMLEQLSDRYRLLSRGPRDAPERHRSLEACVQWGYDLCTPLEQALWTRMSVFAGGCDLQAATAVCTGAGVEPDALVDLLSGLVEKSVVLAREGPESGARYSLPESLAEFGRRQLPRDGHLERWQGRHLDWCAELAAGFRRQWVGDRQAQLLRRARTEHANIRAALEFAVADPGSARAETGLRIATDLDTFWVTAGLAQEGRHWLETTLATGHGTAAERALAMVLLARFCGLQNDLAAARVWAGQAAAEAESSDNSQAQGLLAVFSAMMAAWDGDPGSAVGESERALDLLRSAGDRAGELLAGSILGVCLGLADQGDAAASAYESAIALAGETGETFRQSFCLMGLGEQALVRGEPERAQDLFREALRAKAALGDRFGIAVALDSLGGAAVAEGRAHRGAVLLGAAGSTWDAIGMQETGNPFARRSKASDGIREARTRLGKRTFRTAFRHGSALSEAQAVAYALEDGPDPEPTPAAQTPLTRRETEVAELVAEGLSNPEIARRLVISVRTAQGHVENILRKLGFTSRAMIASWVTHRRAQQERPQPAPH